MTEVGVTDDNVTDDSVTQPAPHEPSEITFSEQFYPARPRHLRPKARLRSAQVPTVEQLGEPIGSNPSYVRWLRQESMLNDANVIARQFVGRGSMFQNPFAKPNPRAAIETASVWFTAYPISVLGYPAGPSWPRSATQSCGKPSRASEFRGCTPVRSNEPAESAAGHQPPPSMGISIASALRSTRRSAPRPSSARCARSPANTAESSSTTSFRGTRARAPTSGWPR